MKNNPLILFSIQEILAMKTKLFSLAVLAAIYSVTSAHAANNPADAQAAFQEFNEAANALNDLENAPLNQWQDQYNRAVDGLNRLGITGDQQQGDLIANVHNLPSLTALSQWIGGLPQSQVIPVTDTKALEEGQSKIADNQARTSTQHVDEIQAMALTQQERDNGQDLAISDTHATASQAMTEALSAQSYAENVHDQVTRMGVDVDTNKAKNDIQDQEISGLTTQGNTNAQNIADEAKSRKDSDTVTRTQIANNASAIRGVRSEQTAQSDYIQKQSHVINQHSATLQQHSAQIYRNTSDIQKNTKDIADTKEKLKKGLNNAAAMSSLHFDANKNSWALSTGTANGDGAALAGGLQKQLTEHTAVTVQFSDSMSGDWMAGAGIHGDY
ncbi:hypothetical protein [Citrobacter amalonaticus]|uniref:hypothetical protein n=1 Tax=Citrobacter amalonaticus TaxID=35703 RepID=UPI00300D212B